MTTPSKTWGNEIIVQPGREKIGITTSIIVPAFNEEKGLPIVLDKILRCTNGIHEIIVVDDGSTDGTADAAFGFPCKVIRHKQNCGKGQALQTGVRHAQGENIIFIDSDDTYPAEALPVITEHLNRFDVVYGSRTYGRDNIPRFNQVGNWIFQSTMRLVFRFKANDYATGLYGLKKAHWDAMHISSSGFAIEPEIAIKSSRMKLRVMDAPIQYGSRIGTSKLSSYQAGFEHLKIMLRHLFWKPDIRRSTD